MKAVTSTWFECAVRYGRTTEEGPEKKVTETYVVEALSFTEAEAKIIRELSPFTPGELEIKKITPMSISEIFFSDRDADDSWFKCKLAFITIDEKTAVEKRTASYQLVQASDLKSALSVFLEGMHDTMADFEIASIAETPLMDVFPANLDETRADREARQKAQNKS